MGNICGRQSEIYRSDDQRGNSRSSTTPRRSDIDFAVTGVYGAMEQESGLGDSGRKSIRGASWRMKKVIIPVMHCN